MSADVVIVGAGVAGLAAATAVMRSGFDPLVLEASDDVGGRVRTDVVDGYTIDRGFQVIASAYPELRRVIDMGELGLRPFVPGIGVYGGGRVHRLIDPRHSVISARDFATAPVGSWRDKLALARYGALLVGSDTDALKRRPDTAMADALSAAGIGSTAVARVVRPYLQGVLLDAGLSTSRRFVDLALRTQLRGPVGVPTLGMQQLPRVMARQLPPDCIRTGSRVVRVAADGVDTEAERVPARAVIVATESAAASPLVGLREVPSRGVVTFFHTTETSPTSDALLHVDGEQALIANSVVLTQAAPEYAPAGRHLVATSVLHPAAVELGTSHTEALVRRRLSSIFRTSTAAWDLVAVRDVPAALPHFAPGTPLVRSARVSDGLYVAGDHRATPSLQGALVSGRRAAEAAVGYLTRGR